jgi:hypothetical protein
MTNSAFTASNPLKSTSKLCSRNSVSWYQEATYSRTFWPYWWLTIRLSEDSGAA